MSAKRLQKECLHADCEFWETPFGLIMVTGACVRVKERAVAATSQPATCVRVVLKGRASSVDMPRTSWIHGKMMIA
jgi:hypothetical protein